MYIHVVDTDIHCMGYFTADTRHMLFGDDGSETRLSITVLSPQAPSQYHIHYQVMGIQQAKKNFFLNFFFFQTTLKNCMERCVWQNYSFTDKLMNVNDKIGTDD